MGISKLFRPFKKKLILEGVFRSLLLSIATGATAVFTISLFYHIKIKETPILTVCAIGVGVMLLTFFVFFFLIYYPKRKKVAKRIDEIGLQERASTMLEYRKDSSDIVQLQREDAVQKIKSVSAKQLKMRIHRVEIICCGVCLCLAVSMTVLPYDVFAFGNGDIISAAEQEENIKELIEQLREEVKAAELDDDLKESLNEIIDELEESLKESDSELEQAAKIEQAKEKMQELLDQAITKDEIGQALQKYELTRALGEAISKGDTEKVTTAMDDLQTALTEDTALVTELSETLAKALEESGVDTTDALYLALADFSSALSEMDITSEDFKTNLTSAFDTAESAIIAALEKQATIESEKEKMEDAMDKAKNEALGNEQEEKPEDEESEQSEDGETPEGEQPEGEMPEGEMPEGEPPEGSGEGTGEGSGEGTGSTMTEGIYDPVSGSVSYGEVFAAYYAEYLAALEAGEVPEELQEIIDKYYSSLN